VIRWQLAATDPKRTVAIPMRNGSIVAPIRSRPHVQRAQYEKRRQEATDDDSERAEGEEEVQERSDEVSASVTPGRYTAQSSRWSDTAQNEGY